jgi:hypothetical protein
LFADVMREAHELAESVVTTAIDIGNLQAGTGDAARAGQAYRVSLDLAQQIGSAELAGLAESARMALAGIH